MRKGPTNTPGSSKKKTCLNKRKFSNHQQAHAAMMFFRERKGGVATTQVYACKICGGYHWGHKKGTIVDRSQRLRNIIDIAMARDATKRKQHA